MHKFTKRGARIAALLSVTACASVGPDYRRPEIALPPQFVGGGSLPAELNSTWWRGLGDPLLDQLITEGLLQNLPLQVAQARVAQAQELLLQQGPLSRLSGEARLEREEILRLDDGSRDSTDRAQLGAAFVLDLFGRGQRATEQARAQRDAQIYQEAAERLAFQAQLVATYLEARFQQASLRSLEQSLAGRQRILGLIREQYALGMSTVLDVTRAEAEIDSARATLPERRAAYQRAVFGIATLLAEPASALLGRMDRDPRQPLPAADPDLGLPVQLVRNRPDVRRAEAELIAATAAIGVATADLYPSLSLGGTISARPGEAVVFGPLLTLPVFDRGVLASRRREAVLRARGAELVWRQAVLVAVEEVQRHYAAVAGWRQKASALAKAEASLSRLLTLSNESFRAGETLALELIDTQQDLNATRLARIAALNDLAMSWSQLQIAIGAGWQPMAIPEPDAAGRIVVAN